MSFDFATFTKSKEDKNLLGRIRPSGRFSYLKVFKRRDRPKKSTEPSVKPALEAILQCWAFLALDPLERLERSHLYKFLLPSKKYLEGIGLSNESISECRARRGSKGINSRQRDVLCWGANAIEHVYGRSNLSFLTLTLPDLTERDFNSVRENWAEIVHYVQRLIHGRLNDKGIKTTICGCTELQMERAKDCKRFYPHLHLVFRGRKGSRDGWAIAPSTFRTFWIRSVRRFLRDGVNSWKASENVQRVQKSIGGYLSKYLSKCASKHDPSALGQWHPTDWILLSRNIRALYETLSCGGADCGVALFNITHQWVAGMGFKRPIEIRSEKYGRRQIGEWGWLKGWLVFPEYLDIHPQISNVL